MLDARDRLLLLVTDSKCGAGCMFLLSLLYLLRRDCVPLLGSQIMCWLMVSRVEECIFAVCEHLWELCCFKFGLLRTSCVELYEKKLACACQHQISTLSRTTYVRSIICEVFARSSRTLLSQNSRLWLNGCEQSPFLCCCSPFLQGDCRIIFALR